MEKKQIENNQENENLDYPRTQIIIGEFQLTTRSNNLKEVRKVTLSILKDLNVKQILNAKTPNIIITQEVD